MVLGVKADAAQGVSHWMNREVFQRVHITGSRRLGYHDHEVSGDLEAFRSETYYGLGDRRFTDVGQLNIAGRKVLGVLNFNLSISDNRFSDPQSQKVTLNYLKGPLVIDAGDIQGSLLGGNRFASFSKSLRGVATTFRDGRLAVKAVRSESRGSAKTVSLSGNNSSGPYFLGASQIVADSESVRVDGVEMRLGQDYVINYELGAITFVSRLVPPTSTIVVSYEAFGFNAQRGTVQGAGAQYELGRFGRIGVTYLEQRSRSGGGLSTRLEQFQGFGAPSTPYFLQFEPLASQPITIRVDGVLQVDGVDYHFDPLNPSVFFFHRFVPSTSIVDVVYTPRPTQTVDGDRRVTGFDYRLPLGTRGAAGYLSFSLARGELLSDVNPLSGVARGVEGQYRTGPLEIRGSVRDVPDGYTSVETRGFNRNERAVDFSAEVHRAPFDYGASHQNSSISVRRTTTTGSVEFDRTRATQTRGFATYRPKEEISYSLEHVRTNSMFLGRDTRLDTTTLSGTRRFGNLRTTLGLERQSGFGPIGTGSTPTDGSLELNTIRLDAAATVGTDWTLSGRASFSQVRTDEKSGNGRDWTFAARYHPSDRLFVNASYTLSDSGQLATLGSFQNGQGFGYGGNGFSGGVGAGAFGGGTDTRLFQVSSGYRVSDRVSLDARFYETRYVGSVTSNSETTAVGMGLHWDLGGSNALDFSLDQSRTRFVGSDLSSDALTVYGALSGSPGRWSYRVGASTLASGGNSQFRQDNAMFDGSLGYRLDPRQRLRASFQTGRSQGYLPQDDAFFGLSHDYQIYQNVALVTSYRWRKVRNLDPLVTSGAYRSSGFDIELAFNFR